MEKLLFEVDVKFVTEDGGRNTSNIWVLGWYCGSMVLCEYIIMVLLYNGLMILWYYGVMVLWYHGIIGLWYYTMV